jgi:thiol-disulfide isomerase/thioredoxin
MYLKKNFNLIVLSLVAVFIFACSKDNPTEPGSGTFVSKKAENKAVLLEEYTGIYCGYCPDGHRMADSLAKVHSGRFFHINIHAGSYAAMYSTQVGGQLLSAFPVQGFPMAVLNRQRFSNVYGQNRGSWASQAQQILNAPAYANIAARAEINGKKLTVRVQVYFTGDSDVGDGENYVHIALLQDNIWGPQGGGKQFYPEMWDDAKQQYKHNHMLRAMITGLNGETVGKNTKGTLYRKTFTYDIPEKITNEDVVLKDLVVLAFVTEKTPADAKTVAPKVINVCKSTLSIK